MYLWTIWPPVCNPFEIGKTRFLKEARTLSEFVGEGNIVALRAYFEEYGTAYIVMEYLEGEDLSHYAKEHGVLELGESPEARKAAKARQSGAGE